MEVTQAISSIADSSTDIEVCIETTSISVNIKTLLEDRLVLVESLSNTK